MEISRSTTVILAGLLSLVSGYQLNITVDDVISELYFNGVSYDNLPHRSTFNVKDQVDLASTPSLIAVKGRNLGGIYGILADDSEGHSTDTSWKCTDVSYNDWMLPSYDDSKWPAAVTKNTNSARKRIVSGIRLNTTFIWSPVYNSETNSAYCRLHIATGPTKAPTVAPTDAPTTTPTEPPTDAPTDAPTPPPTEPPTVLTTKAPTVAPTETPQPTVPPTTASPLIPRPIRPYQLNITVDDNLKELYFDGVVYTSFLPFRGAFATKDTINLEKQPSLIAVRGWDGGGVYGVLASDSEGFLTDGSWKCTHIFYANWFSSSYDDSAWPAAQVFYANGDHTSKINTDYLGFKPVDDISYRANWIWSPVFDSTTRETYCRFRLPMYDSCSTSPCKNGGVCKPYNNAALFWCDCAAGFSGATCAYPVTKYQVNITGDDRLWEVFVDGRLYDMPHYLEWSIEGSLNFNFLPSVIAVSAYNSAALFGILASDSAGFVTDASWKCSKDYETNWMLPSFDDSKWSDAWLESVNGNCISKINIDWHGWTPIADISNRAHWIWPSNYDSVKNFAYCRVRLPAKGNACYSSPCKNGGQCTNVGATFTCSCSTGFSGPMCTQPAQPYHINITADDILVQMYVDGVPYDVPNSGAWSLSGTVKLDFMPSVIGVYAKLTAALYGILASDSAGFVTDGSWKCTKNVYSDWMLTSFDDSDWPAALVEEVNGNCLSSVNIGYHGWVPIDGISNRAYWIWAKDYNTSISYNYVHCRFRLPAAGNACFSSPCKNGGKCTNSGASFTCVCAAGFSGPQCLDPAQPYHINVTVDDILIQLYVDGVPYDVPNKGVWYLPGTIKLDFMPSVIAVYGKNAGAYTGMLASDSAGFVTDGSWKCTKEVFSDWMLPSFDDSKWPMALVEEMNGNRSSGVNSGYHSWLPIDGVSNRAFWIWAKDFNTTLAYDYTHCRLTLPPSGNACFSYPCKNGGKCTNSGASFKCTCPAGFTGPQCTNDRWTQSRTGCKCYFDNTKTDCACCFDGACQCPAATRNQCVPCGDATPCGTTVAVSYQLSITSANHVLDLYLDGVRYDVPNADIYNLIGTVYADFAPKIIAVYAKNDGILPGLLASDNRGMKTGTGWKCTRFPYPNWMLVSFDDSQWPAADIKTRNGDVTAQINVVYNSGKPISGISNDAWWVWSKDMASLNYVYCRSPLLS